LTSALIEADFKNAEVNMGSLWQKQINEDGHIRAQLMLTDREGKRSNTIHLTDIRAEAPDLDIRGSVEFAENFKLLGVDMNTLKIGGLVDASMGAKPDVGGVLAVDLKGAYLSVEPWVQRAFRSPSRAATLPIMLKADMEKLALNTDYVLKDAKLVFSHTGKAVKLARLNGQVDKGDFVAEIVEMRETATRSVHIDVPNAQTALFTLLGLDYITGGTLNIDGVLPAVGEQGGLVAQLILEDFTLTKAPAFTQILSLASLTGLASTLSGSGLAFTKLDLQFSMQNNQLKIRDGRASGAALGITGEGDIDLGKRIVDFDGVLVPAYGVNSVMGKIPVLGGVIVGKKGEGLFALNYAVKGPFAQTQISVNPLSALTPGFLRRVFDVKRDDVNRPALSGIKEDTADKPADADPKN
ncbi:MAG TPA: hypothetical protein ENJ46_02350, partial [Hellea balneolensis]|nr:hypothetical protein [Hellea balneolensis]